MPEEMICGMNLGVGHMGMNEFTHGMICVVVCKQRGLAMPEEMIWGMNLGVGHMGMNVFANGMICVIVRKQGEERHSMPKQG